MAKLIPKPKMSTAEAAYVPALAKGLRVTIGHFIRNTFNSRSSEKSSIETVVIWLGVNPRCAAQRAR